MRLTVKAIREKKKKGEKIVSLTAYDFLFAGILDQENIDIILVGDSVGMVLLGYESTVSVTMREMLHHTKAVSRAVKQALVVADMPFGSYDTPERALRNARRFVQEAGANAVKLEGGSTVRDQVRALTAAGISVMGHLGMTPQSFGALGGYVVQGRERAGAEQILRDAALLDNLGVFSLVLECVPAELGKTVTQTVQCPTIGIGAGSGTDGQILVLHDMLGFQGKVKPRFVRRYGDLERAMREAVAAYCRDVLEGKFPSGEESF